MYKFLVLCVLWTASHSANVEWFNGRWIPIVMYSNQFTKKTVETIAWTVPHNDYLESWTGWFLKQEECGWLGIVSTNQQCTCDGRTVPLVTLKDFGDLSKHQFYEFRFNEPRPVIVVDHLYEIQSALSARCMCSGEEMLQLVFRKTFDNHLVSYEKKERTDTSPNMILVMMDQVPSMTELQQATEDPMFYSLNQRYKRPTLMCQPNFFDASAFVIDSSKTNSEQVTEYYDYYDDFESSSSPLTEIESTTETGPESSTNADYDHVESIWRWIENESSTETVYESSTQGKYVDVESSPTPAPYYDYYDYNLWTKNESSTGAEYESSTHDENDDVESSASTSVESSSARSENDYVSSSCAPLLNIFLVQLVLCFYILS